jgi:predicted DNA-binding transcriptional regulator AlpA
MSRAKRSSLTSAELLSGLPPEVAKYRVLDTRQTCAFVGTSIPNWRLMRSRGEAPAPILIGRKKHGWRVGDLIAWLDSRAAHPPGAIAA